MNAANRLSAWFAALGLWAWMAAGCTSPAHALATPDAPPAIEQRGDDVVVPERSPVRQRLPIAPVVTQRVRHELELPGTAEADPARITKIAPPLQGRVVKLLVRLGDAVREGAPLLSFDSPDVAAAQSDYLKARSAEAQAARALKRQKDLSDHGIAAQKELEQAETDHEQARSELARATMRLQLLGMAPGDVGKPLTVRAPFSGRVIDLATAPGQYQNDLAAALMTIADLSKIWVTAQVSEKDLQRVMVGDEALVVFNAYPGEQFHGRVQFIWDVLAPETRTVKARILLGNEDHRLKPGMFARVTVRAKEAPALVVPASALLVRGDKNFVVVEKSAWTFERRPVDVGQPVAGGITVDRGLAAGERIVTANTILFQ